MISCIILLSLNHTFINLLNYCHFVFPGGLGENTFYVDYRTEDGSANAGSDYEYSEGTLVFKPGDTRKEIKVSDSGWSPPSTVSLV